MSISKYKTGKDSLPGCSASTSRSVCMTAEKMGGTETKEDLLVIEPKVQNKRPPFFKVVMLNDDYTPMDFVVDILKGVFRKTHHDAINIMLEIHHKGAGTCGVFTRDVAETKIDMVVNRAKENEYPLQCVMERE